ncbi:MAG: aminoglycoside phosphotransferase family protein [Nocardiopsaceae bacterium]|nr:aminoglycoside phosphotransferase family protein [Nocardiopsaceae bacterium]
MDDARLVAEVTACLSLRFGSGVAAWCSAVPALAREVADRWGLTLGERYAYGASSVVLYCSQAGGGSAVLKLSPDPPFLAGQAAMLGLFAPSGKVPAVLAVDAGAGAVLLESIEPGTSADDLPHPPAAQAWGDLILALHNAAPAPPGFPRDLRGRCDEFFARIGRRLAEPPIGKQVRQADLDRAARRYGLLLDTAPSQVLLHGDLHLGNVLDGGPSRGLVAIDPRACAGDPCFDAVDYALDGAGRDGVGNRCALLAPAAGLDPDRLYAWCCAIAPIIAINRIGHPGNQHAVAELLTLAR